MSKTLDQFVKDNLGDKLDFDNYAGGQCVDLVRYYIQDVLDFPQPLPVVGAKNLWTNYDIDPNLYNYYDRIPNTLMALPQKGDIPIWDGKVGDGFGHTSVWLSGGRWVFKSFDQNDPTWNVCTITEHGYSNLYGWLRPKISVDVCKDLELENELLRNELVSALDHEKFWFDALKLVSLPEDSKWKVYKKEILKIYKENSDLKDEVTKLKGLIAVNAPALFSKKDDKYTYSNTDIIKELLRRLGG